MVHSQNVKIAQLIAALEAKGIWLQNPLEFHSTVTVDHKVYQALQSDGSQLDVILADYGEDGYRLFVECDRATPRGDAVVIASLIDPI